MEFLSTPENPLNLNMITGLAHYHVYPMRAAGNSMVNSGIHDGDILIVDLAVEAKDGDVVIADYNGEYFCRRLQTNPPALIADCNNPEVKPIYISQDPTHEDGKPYGVFGVVDKVVKRLNCG